MRTQSHFFPSSDGDGYDEWDVARLLTLSAGLPVRSVAVSAIAELDDDYWTERTPSPRKTTFNPRH